MLIAIGTLLIAAWGLFFALVLPGNYVAGTTTFGVGLAVTAFALGMRHAFDADHIAAIDNTTRKLIGDNKDASSVGLWFALGHSTVVLVAVGLISAGLSAFTAQIDDDASPIGAFTGVWGPTVSSIFLLLIGTVNLIALVRIVRRRGLVHVGGEYQTEPMSGGLVMRALVKVNGSLDRPWKMYVVGLLFGLGFDTASTIVLLLVTGGAGIVMPWYAAMVLPLLFTAGIVTCDGLNSIVMSRAYMWTIGRPRSRTYYNLALIGISVAVAFSVGIVGLSDVFVDVLNVNANPIRTVAGTDLNYFGFIVVGLLISVWAVSYLISRVRR
ncbi:HoxN/HupN/NixA family nickel/cobalt transporter [Cryobacterium sp. N21]|uniref:HoxN/HupN/NixA family nickel/cobalt transporter n=1 Tax=Cryobacterium sp. N21 TaxID=2048289 RepID=UPI001304A8D5|nr:HoxN/HupN/NixA family nickel/cobalt transporter [Cryobacterium sp. N21]